MAMRKALNLIATSTSTSSVQSSSSSFLVVQQLLSSQSTFSRDYCISVSDTNVLRTKLSVCHKDQYNYILNCLIKMSGEKRTSGNQNKSLRIAVEGNIASGKSSIIRYLETKFEAVLGVADKSALVTGAEISPRKKPYNSACGIGANMNLKVLLEPVHLWRNLNGVNLLDLMYADPVKWSYPFHSYVQLTMLKNHLDMAAHGNQLGVGDEHCISIMERSLYSARYCFAENLYRKNLMKPVEYEILDRWFRWMIQNHDCNIDLVFYLRTKPETCMRRLHMRGRHEEIDRISLDYLANLHELHEAWLNRGDADHVTTSTSSLIDAVDDTGDIIVSYYKPANVIIIDADQSIDQVYKTIEHETRNAAATMVA